MVFIFYNMTIVFALMFFLGTLLITTTATLYGLSIVIYSRFFQTLSESSRGGGRVSHGFHIDRPLH